MPPAFAYPGKGRFAKAHLEFVPQNQPDDQFAAVAPGSFTTRQCRRENVGRMRWILLPVNIVVIHAPDHQGVGQRGGDCVNALAGADHRSQTTPGNLVQHLQCDLHIMLLVTAQRAADGIEQKSLGLVNGFFRKLLVAYARSPTRHLGGDGFPGGCFFIGGRSLADTNSPVSLTGTNHAPN